MFRVSEFFSCLHSNNEVYFAAAPQRLVLLTLAMARMKKIPKKTIMSNVSSSRPAQIQARAYLE
jgi:hypothetical protein